MVKFSSYGRYIAYFIFICLAVGVGNKFYDDWRGTDLAWSFQNVDSRVRLCQELTINEATATRSHVDAGILELRSELSLIREELRLVRDSRDAASWTVTVTPKPAASSPSVTSLSE